MEKAKNPQVKSRYPAKKQLPNRASSSYNTTDILHKPLPVKTAENLKKVSLILFIILGLTHILTGFLMTSAIGLPYTLIINHILDIPFAMTALIYGLSSIKAGLKNGGNKIISILFIILALLIFAGLLYINVFVPDKITV